MNRTTGAERRNARMHKIFEDARRLKVDKAYPQLIEGLRAWAALMDNALHDDQFEPRECMQAVFTETTALLVKFGEM